MPPENDFADDQDQSETFDETNMTEDGEDLANFDEIADVYDSTSAVGDDDEDDETALDENEVDDGDLDAVDDELEDDELDPDGGDVATRLEDRAEDGGEIDEDDALTLEDDDLDEDGALAHASDEVELVYEDPETLAADRVTHGAASRMESRSLDDDDLEDLGYGDGEGHALDKSA